MDAQTKGAWLVHHTHKLEQVHGVQQFDKIFPAGKAGILLSALSASDQTSLDNERVELLAKAASINTVSNCRSSLNSLKSEASSKFQKNQKLQGELFEHGTVILAGIKKRME